MIDLYISQQGCAADPHLATITPRTPKGTAWLSQKIFYTKWDPVVVQLDKPVTLSLDGAIEIDALARADHLNTEGI
jgi:hypothetical protein